MKSYTTVLDTLFSRPLLLLLVSVPVLYSGLQEEEINNLEIDPKGFRELWVKTADPAAALKKVRISGGTLPYRLHMQVINGALNISCSSLGAG